MKQIYITFIALIFSITLFAQGIAVQGIARDDNKAAITQTTLNFTFRILATDNSERYTENASIRTDNFGVFSHIVGTGTKLNGLDFSEQGLRIEVSVLYPTKVVVYDEGFNYTPYAHYANNATNAVTAANGVPTGSILPFMGTTVPDGWLLCDGRDIPSQYTTLRAMFSNNKTPNLQGRFLKGAGTNNNDNELSTNIHDNTTLGEYQDQVIQSHTHDEGSLKTNSDGAHRHNDLLTDTTGSIKDGGQRVFNSITNKDHFREDAHNGDSAGRGSYSGNSGVSVDLIGSKNSGHNHNITGDTGSTGGKENRPNNFSVNYIIKL